MQKYINDVILLIPEIDWKQANAYTFQWYYDYDLISTKYSDTYCPTKVGVHNIKLVITDKLSNYSTTTTTQVNITIGKNQNYIPTV